jgi:hypothetical protein
MFSRLASLMSRLNSFAKPLTCHSVSLDESSFRTSSHGTILAFPESISAMRRATSSSQAAATASSCVSSRLSMSEPARSARSDTGRESAFSKARRLPGSWLHFTPKECDRGNNRTRRVARRRNPESFGLPSIERGTSRTLTAQNISSLFSDF